MASLNVDKFLKNLGASGPSVNSAKTFAPATNKLVMVAMAIIGIMVILVLIHFLVYPIFKTKMGSKGVIPLPTTPEGDLLWDDKASDSKAITGTPLENLTANYTISLDAYIEVPYITGNQYRTLFVRKTDPANTSNSQNPNTIQEQIGNFNLAIYLEKGKNDLSVSTMLTNSSIKTIQIKNAPVREPFRLVVVLGDAYMDVYLNGSLSGTATFSNPPYIAANNLFGPSSSSVQVKRAKAFGKALEPAEAKDIRPKIAEFTPSGDIPNSPTCSS